MPTVAGILQVVAPAYVRKLRRRTDWGGPTDDPVQRVKNAVEKLFRSQGEPDISVYLVNDDDDLRRVALGMNAGRSSLSEAVPFVAFLPSELEALEIQATRTPGDLPCRHARSLHFDMRASDGQLALLCEFAMTSGRVAGNCSEGMMRDVLAAATSEKCRTVTQEGTCEVRSCNSS